MIRLHPIVNRVLDRIDRARGVDVVELRDELDRARGVIFVLRARVEAHEHRATLIEAARRRHDVAVSSHAIANRIRACERVLDVAIVETVWQVTAYVVVGVGYDEPQIREVIKNSVAMWVVVEAHFIVHDESEPAREVDDE